MSTKQTNASRQRPIRIAMLGHKFIPSRDGGIEVVVSELASRMVSHGHSVTCYNRTGAQQKAEKKRGSLPREYQGARLVWVPTINRTGLAALSASFFATVRAAFGPYDIVHFHAEGPCFICWLPKLLGKKVIVTIHGLDQQRQKWGKAASSFIMIGEKNAVRFADRIIVLSKNAQTYFKEKYGRETVLIHNGIEPVDSRDAKEITDKFGLRKNEYILFLGRLVPEKGIHYLIEAYNGLKTDKKLVIAGGSSDTDSYTQQLHEMAKENPNIVFTGFVQGAILEELFSNAYLYVLPSDLEGMPISLLEAMSYGCCCLTSDISECTDVTGNSGFSFRKGDAEQLRASLETLLDDPQTADRAGKQAKADAALRFSWENAVEQTLALYRQALNQ